MRPLEKNNDDPSTLAAHRWSLALALTLAACASKEPVPEPVEPGQTTRSTPYKSTQGMSPAMADAAQRALEPGLPTEAEKAKIFRGTGVLVKGQQPGGGVPPGTGGRSRRRAAASCSISRAPTSAR